MINKITRNEYTIKYKEFIPINIMKWYQKYEIGLIKYLFIIPCLISKIIWDDVTQEDLSCPTIIDKKIKIINLSKEKKSDVPDIEIGEWLLDSKINVHIWYSIKRPDNIANRPIRAFALYSSEWIQFILNIEKYFFKFIWDIYLGTEKTFS